MADSLSRLLPQLLKQGYDNIYVLDDASTDNSNQIVAMFGPKVIWIGGKTNIGSGGNRNRILEAHAGESIIHFLDADVRLVTTDIVAKAQQLMDYPNVAFVGGLVLDTKGRQHLWNYGPDSISLYTTLTGQIQYLFGRIQAPKPIWRKLIRVVTKRARSEWPDIAVPPKRRPVYWSVEGNILVKRSVLEKLGGFDETVLEFDIIPLARKAYETCMVSFFDPSISVTHFAANVRQYNREITKQKELHMLIKRYGGWLKYLFPNGHFKPKHNK